MCVCVCIYIYTHTHTYIYIRDLKVILHLCLIMGYIGTQVICYTVMF